jgi:hypothetical protein
MDCYSLKARSSIRDKMVGTFIGLHTESADDDAALFSFCWIDDGGTAGGSDDLFSGVGNLGRADRWCCCRCLTEWTYVSI